MKKIVVILITVMILLTLCACGNEADQDNTPVVEIPDAGKNAPNGDLIQENITTILMEKNPYAAITGIETVKSLTNEGSFEATFRLTAETKYADWEYEVDVSYTEYDQGWIIDNADWVSENYALTRIPTQEDMITIATQDINKSNLSDKDSRLPIENGEIAYNESTQTLDFKWGYKEDCLHGDAIYERETSWEYNVESDEWIRTSSSTSRIGFQYEVLDYSGSWRFGDLEKIGALDDLGNFIYPDEIMNAEAVISNCTEDSFDLYHPLFSTEVVHFYKTDNYPTNFGNNILYYTDGNDHYINFNFQKDYLLLSIVGPPYNPPSSPYTLLAQTAIIKELPTID